MRTKKNQLKYLCVVAGVLLSGPALAQSGGCCAGGVGASATTGLGERSPAAAANLTLDPAWPIYEFQRDGVTYLQINDASGGVRAVVARIDNAMWVLPMGKDADRVSVPSANTLWGNPTSAATAAEPGPNARTIYRTTHFTVQVERQAYEERWKVSPSQ
ncbi:hypothetical protein CAI18_11315 [Xanthomonas citri pv. punicae]|nr:MULTISPECIES: hypothetical protein [Xanthomonas]KAB0531391.1 hypothetical protein F7R02_19430 [Xanthomonas cissicola]MDS0761525.1 hypothetical protein [Xanthomonas citri pv. punicae]MDS0765306.1 hypothetical protein [Xanthomonas citri pv. punicae]MDS0800069.1 hypothetical protein [Xanthomonas citri pv. punicae]MDS0832713.1 hypothetical protein [Xanthomonas citri pv. punicae]